MGLRFNYTGRLFLLMLAFCAVIIGCFIVFQYGREKEFKTDLLDTQLQDVNMDAVAWNTAYNTWRGFNPGRQDIRLSVISPEGKLIYDNSLLTLPDDDHNTRPEIVEARNTGHGRSIDRTSETNKIEYFYSATLLPDGKVVRTAMPYSMSLRDVLRVDSTFIYFMLGVMIIMAIAGYLVTRKLGSTIRRLNRFAESAEHGNLPVNVPPFPNDELGSIASRIVRLYMRLQQASNDRDREHDRALHQEHEKIRIKKQLTNNINHELKTPVASIQLCLETLLTHPDLPQAKRDEFLKRCSDNALRLSQLLADVGTITRLDDGDRQIEIGPVNLHDLAEQAISDESMRPEAGNFKIINDIPDNTIVQGNAWLLTSVFRNLLNNAISYSKGSEIKISLLSENQHQFMLEFKDNGIGVAEKHLEHIFERFYRVDYGRDRTTGGTGLGLAIVKNSLAFHKGVITASNIMPHGLRFVFTLGRDLPKSCPE